MNLPRFALDHRAVVVAFAGVLLAAGALNFATMSRREDPVITIREALIVTRWPGAPATRVEELITDPVEEIVVEIAEVDSIESTSLVGASIVKVTSSSVCAVETKNFSWAFTIPRSSNSSVKWSCLAASAVSMVRKSVTS